MSSCRRCGKEFNFPYLLSRHLDRKYPCVSIKTLLERAEKSRNNDIKKQESKRGIQCKRCEKWYSRKENLKRHSETCKGIKTLQCPICLKEFRSYQTKYYHRSHVTCKPNTIVETPQEEIQRLREEVENLRTRLGEADGTSGTSGARVRHEVVYDANTGCLTTTDPNAPSPELLCYDGFKRACDQADIGTFDFDKDELDELVNRIRRSTDFDPFYKYMFRMRFNGRLHMFHLGKNSNTKNIQVFNKGVIESIEKRELFDEVCKDICHLLLQISMDYLDILSDIYHKPASRRGFMEALRDRSPTFDYFKANLRPPEREA